MMHIPGIDLVRAVDVGLAHTPDPIILDWATRNNRIILTTDSKTMRPFAYERVAQRLPMPGVFVVPNRPPWEALIADISLILRASQPHEWAGQVVHLPFRPLPG